MALTPEQQAEYFGIATSPLRQPQNFQYGVPMGMTPVSGDTSNNGVPLMAPDTPPEIRHGDPRKPAPADNTRTVSRLNNVKPMSNAKMPNTPAMDDNTGVGKGVTTPPPQVAIGAPPQVGEAPVETKPLDDYGYGDNHQAEPNRRQVQQTAPVQAPKKTGDKYQSIYGLLFGNEPYDEGKKWISYMEHGMQSPVNDNSMLQRNVANEIALLKANQDKSIAQQQLDQQNRMYKNDNAEVRYKKMALFDQRKSLLDKWEKGKFLGDDENVTKDFFDNLNRIDQILHDEYDVDTRLLDYPSTNPGGFSTQFKKEVTDPTNVAINLSSWMKHIYDQVQKDPSWLNSPEGTEAFDKLGEYSILQEAESKGAIADAEKVRIQVETMAPVDRQIYNNAIQQFLLCNQAVQVLAQSNQLDHSTLSSLQEWDRLMNGLADYDDDVKEGGRSQRQSRDEYLQGLRDAMKKPSKSLGKAGGSFIADTILGVYNGLQRAGQNIPIELQAAVSSMKNGMDQYQQYLMQSAPTNKKLIWNVASRVFDRARDKSAFWNRVGGHRYGFGTGHLWNPSNPQFADWLGQYQAQYPNADPVLGTGFTTSKAPPHPVHPGLLGGDYGANNN